MQGKYLRIKQEYYMKKVRKIDLKDYLEKRSLKKELRNFFVPKYITYDVFWKRMKFANWTKLEIEKLEEFLGVEITD